MEALAYVDEVKELIERMGAKGRKVQLIPQSDRFTFIQQFHHLSPIDMCELLAKMGGDLKANLVLMIAAFKGGELKLAK
jgi:hypothetical protein